MRQPSNGWSVALAALFLLISAVATDQGSTSVCDPSVEVACRNYPNICIELERVQDGVEDCPDASDEDCQPWEFTCSCGQPRCITGSLVGNGVLDCADGSDEGLIGGNCNSDENLQNIDDLVRFRRASSDVRVEVNGGQTTTFFLKTDSPPSRPRPLGIITSTKGAFVNEGTTTEYTTQIVGTSVDGTYAKIQSTKSRVFSLLPTESFVLPVELLPTGLVSSSLVTRIRGETTTIETTEFVRTFIDQAYVQEILTSSEIFAPLKPVDLIQPSAVSQIVIPTVVIDSSLASEDDSGKIVFKTSHLTSIVGERVIQSSIDVNQPSDEDKMTEEDSKKIITDFEEVPDNNLRGSRARSDLSEPVVSTKPAVVLETVVAAQSVKSVESSTELVPEEPLLLDESVDVTTPSFEDSPVDQPKSSVSEQLQSLAAIMTGQIDEVANEPTEQSNLADLKEVAAADEEVETAPTTDIPEDATEMSTEGELSSQRAPRVETRPTISPAIPVLATLQLKTSEPVQPVGLISSFEGSLVNEGTTTVYTSLIFGTVIDGEWANVVSTVTTVITPTLASSIVNATTSPDVVSSTPSVAVVASAPVAVVVTALPAETVPAQPEVESSLNVPIEASTPLAETPTGLLSVTRVTTFTFFTTFTETKEDQVITSVSTREVVSSDVQFVEETVHPDDIVEMMLDKPSNDTDPSVTTIFKTYTYISTLFDDLTTKTITREEVESSVVTLTDGHLSATPLVQESTRPVEVEATKAVGEIQPGVIESSMMEKLDEAKKAELFSSLAGGIVKTFFTTFTFFTTALINGTTLVSSRTVVSTSTVTPTIQLADIDEKFLELFKAQENSSSIAISATTSASESSVPVSDIVSSSSVSVIEPTTTVSTSVPLVVPSIDVVVPVVVVSTPETPTILEPVTPEPTEETAATTTDEPVDSTTPVSESVPDVSVQSTTESAPTVSSEPPSESESVPPVSEAPVPTTDDTVPTIEPSTTIDPSLPQTLYTTFTYFTTFFTAGTASVSSREETVTNVVTDTDAIVEATVQSVFPITYFTTFTYRTTSFSEGETFVSTREETVTNIVTPTVGVEASEASSSVEAIAATAVPVLITPTPTIDPALTTFYTTFTYFATSFEADTAIVTSSLETITNIVSASETIQPSVTATVTPSAGVDIQPSPVGQETDTNNTARNIGSNPVSQLILDLSDSDKTTLPTSTGLLSTIRSTKISDGVTTVFTTDVLGTFINGQYARILESSSEVLNPGDRVPATVIVAASGVEGVEASDLFPQVVTTELEGSIVQSEGPSSTTESGAELLDNQASKVEGGGRITTRLSAPVRNRTFVPAIRPFTQRPRPPLPTRPRRPPFTSAGSAADTSSSVSPSTASISSSSSRTASFSSRFRPSAASISNTVAVAATTTESSSRSQFFRLRSSLPSSGSNNAINPTPVLSSSSSSLPGRRFSSSIVPSISSAGRSSVGPLAVRRPSLLSSGVRATSGSASSSIGSPSASSSVVPRFGRPSTPAPVTVSDDNTTDDGTEPVATPTTARSTSSFRRPAPIRASPVAESSTASAPIVVPSRRQFPFSRANSRPEVTEANTPAESSTSAPSSSNSGSTSRPRFVRPPKLTFTEKPRPAVRLPSRPGGRPDSSASNTDEATVESPVANERSKRQIDFDYYFYDPAHYRRPSRQQASRSRSRATTPSSRVIESDYDYDQRISQLDYDYFDEQPKVTRARQAAVTSAPTSSLRDRLTANRNNRNQATTPAPRARAPARTSSTSAARQSAVSRARKPAPEEAAGLRRTPATSRSQANSAAARARSRTTTTERPGRRFGTTRRPSTRNRVVNDFQDEEEFISAEPVLPSSAPPLSFPLSVTHKVPTETTIPVVNNGVTEFRTVMAAKPSIEVLEQYSTLRVGGTWRYIASEVSATPAPGTTLVTQFVLKPSETSTVTFTPTTIRGRPTSFSHIVPSTAFEVETVVSTLTDPVASTNSLLQQLLLGGLQQGVPVTSFTTHTSTFVTTLTELKTTKIPITLRGQEIFTTIIGTSTSVITATEFSTETVVTGPTDSPQGNPLASLLPALLGNQLLQAQLLAPQIPMIQPTQALPIVATQAPQMKIVPEIPELVVSRLDEFEEQPFEVIEEQIQETIAPAKPVPATSVITLFLSGRRPGEFSSILSTITLDGIASDSTVVKRQINPSDVLPMEFSELPFMVGTDKGIYELPEHYDSKDLDYYVMSAINEVDAEVIVDVGETERLASIVKKAKNKVSRHVRQVSEDEPVALDDDPLEAVESTVDEVVAEPLPSGRGTLRRKTVTVIRKASDPVPIERKIGEDFVSSNRARKVVVVTRRRPVGSVVDQATDAVEQQTAARRIDVEENVNTDGKPFVVVRKRPINREEEQLPTTQEPPVLVSSKIEPETESPLRNSLFGDVYAPRTYYTVYSYFYTLLNGPSSGQVSTREVSISEIVRGSDGRIPAGFQRTENGNGLYPLSSGSTVADLSTRVNNGITTQVNLASETMVKYGRGPVRASSVGVLPKDETPVRQTTQQMRRVQITPSPRVEPSFDDVISEVGEVTVSPTQRLTTIVRTRGRALDSSAAVRSTVRQPVVVADEATTTSRASGTNRGRGTVRFNPASVLGEDIPTLLTRQRNNINVEPRVPQRTVVTRPTARGSVRGSVVRGQQVVRDPVVRNPVRGRPVQQEQDLFVEEEPFIEDEFIDQNEFNEEPLAEDEYFYDQQEEDPSLIDVPLDEYDYTVDSEPVQEAPVNAVDTPTPVLMAKAIPTAAPSASSSSSTKLMGVTPTRTTISRKLLNPLQSHLSSILANSRSGLRSTSIVQRTNEPGSSVPFRSRGLSSALPTFTTSTVVLKQFQTLSTLAVDGGRSGIPLTLITSTLTTLFDSEISLLTESPDVFKAIVQPTQAPISRPKPLNLKPTARLTLPIRASVAIGLLPSTGIVESTIEDTTTESNFDTTDASIADALLRGGNFVTVVETQLRTFTAVVTRKSGDEEEVTTRLEILPDLVTKTVVQVQPTPVVDVQASLDALENLVPTARAIPSRDGREQLVGDEEIEEVRGARLSVATNNRNPNFATKVMSNGVEVIVAGEKKPTLLAQNVVQKSQTVIEPSPPLTLAATALPNQVTLPKDVDNVRLFSSIQSDPARFQTLTQMTTFTYLTTLFDGASKLVSSREEVITNFVTQEKGRKETIVQPTATVTTGLPGSSNYNTFTQMTTYTYFNTFLDLKRPVVLTSQEIVSNVVTVPVGQQEATERSFETATYLRTYIFSSKLDRDAIATSKEVVTQVVITEAPRLIVQPTPVVTFSEVTKTYLNTLTLLSTQVDGTTSTVHRITTVRPEVVVETIRDFEPTPVLESSQTLPAEEDDFGGPIVATKTYFTTKTHFTTLQQGTKTIVQSRKEVQSSVVTETIDGLSASLFAQAPSSSKVSPTVQARPTYIQLGPNLYGKLRTLFATATYYITNSVGEITSKSLVVPQVTTETVPLELIPSEALIEPSLPVLTDIEATPVPSNSQILTADQLQALKQSFLAGQQSSASLQPSLIISPEQASSLKESFLSSKPSVMPTDTDPVDTSTDPELIDNTTDPAPGDGFNPPDISLTPPDGPSVIMVTNTAGEVLIIPTEILDVQPTVTSGSGISGGTLASILGGLGTLGLTALGQSLANNNNAGGLNINLGPVFDAMTGVLSNGLIASRRNSTDRSDDSPAPPRLSSSNQQSNTIPISRPPTHEPIFIPIGGLAGVDSSQQQLGDVQGRRPPAFIPLRPNVGQLPPNQQQLRPALRRPEPGIPLQPGVPGSPLLRPGAVSGQQFGLGSQVVPTGQPIQFSPPPLQTGFTGMPNQPKSALPATRTAVPGVRPPPLSPPFINGQNNIDRVQIDPSRPIQPPIRAPNGQFFAANGQQINVPPLPGTAAIPPPPASPPPPPPGPVPQPPVDVIRPGAIVPGPDGKPVRIVGVPEGQQPPPGAEGQVFIRPVPVPAPVPLPAGPVSPVLIRNEQQQPPRREDPIVIPPTGTRLPAVQIPPVQTIASVVGENKIVATNIISGGQTIVLQPNDPTPVFNLPSSVLWPSSVLVGVQPSLVEVAGPSEESEGAMEGISSILQPGLAPSVGQPAVEDVSASLTPSHEFAFGSEGGEVDHTPTLNIFSDSPSTEIMPSVFQNAPSEEPTSAPTSAPKWPLVNQDVTVNKEEPFGVTSVLMGPDRQDFTTVVSRVESDGRTAFTTIIQQSTTVSYIEPTSVPTSSSSAPVVKEEIEEEVKVLEPILTFPPDSPFVPPTNQPFRPSSSSSSSSTSTTQKTTTTAAVEPPVAKDVVMDNMGNKVVLGGGFGGSFSVNQPSNIQDGCRGRCSKEKSEICVYANGQHDCLCRPGYSRSDASEVCTKTYTYQLKLVLESKNSTMLHFDNNLMDEISPQYRSLASSARAGLRQALMRTDLSESVQDSQVMGIHPTSKSEIQSDGILVDFFVHLKQQQDEDQIKNMLMKSLESNNYLLGESDIVASRFTDSLLAQDFDECSHEGHHDCSEFADCINERGTYRCQCRPGFVDSSDEDGRICLAERQDCEECNGHGRCVFEPSTNDMTCICNKWFAGKECHINLKVVMIVVLAVGIFVILLITAIIVVCCLRSRRAKGSITGGPSFLRYRGPSVPATGTLDRAAMIRGDTSSEGSGNDNFASSSNTLDGKNRTSTTAATGPALQSYRPYGEGLMIPRAKHQHGPTTASGSNPASAERGEANREHQLIDYLDGRGPKKVLPDSDGKMMEARSTEGLSAAGRTSVSSTSQFRESLGNVESTGKDTQEKPDSSVLDMTVSEVRSFDETTIHPATRRPAKYYQSDAAAMESSGMTPRNAAGARDSVSAGDKKLVQQLLSFPQPFTISRPKLYNPLPRE